MLCLSLTKIQEEYCNEGKDLYMCFVDLDHVARKVVEWAMMKKSLPEIMVISVMSLDDGTNNTSLKLGVLY